MARERSLMAAGVACRRPVLQTLYPELRSVPEPRWPEALRRAREGELDVMERIGVVGSLGVTTYLLQWVDDSSATALTRYLAQFILALPLVGILVSPWLLRRTRRTLRNQAARLHGGESC